MDPLSQQKEKIRKKHLERNIEVGLGVGEAKEKVLAVLIMAELQISNFQMKVAQNGQPQLDPLVLVRPIV